MRRVPFRFLRLQKLVQWSVVTLLALATNGGVDYYLRVLCAAEPEKPNGFASLRKEQQFWTEWSKGHAARLEPFFLLGDSRDAVDERVVEIDKRSDPFVLVINTLPHQRKLKVMCLAKAQRWQQTNWVSDGSTGRVMKESTVRAPLVQDSVLEVLSTGPVFVSDDDPSFDVATTYVLVKYHGKYNRLAVYNASRALADNTKQEKVAAALRSILTDTHALMWGN